MNEDQNSPNPMKGPVVNVGPYDLRSMMNGGEGAHYGLLGEQYQGDRQLYDALGYTQKLRPQHYIAKYRRGPGVATGVVDKPVHDSWAGDLKVTEADASSEEETDFERNVRQFLAGDHTRLSPIARFRAADRWARLLEYSLIFIGVQDENVTEGDSESLKNPVAEDSISSLDDIQFLSVYRQTQVDWDNTELVEDPTDPRYRLPETYSVEITDTEAVDIHHSRIIHVAENPDNDVLRSPSVFQPIYNRLEDIEKLLGGSAEMFWRAAWPGLVLTPPTDADGVPMRFDDDGKSVADQISDYRKNLNRLHKVTGNLTKLDTTVASPEDQVKVQYEDIAAAIDMPMSIIRGNETGERATSEDLSMYHEYITGRQLEHCESAILRRIIDRFLGWGAIPSTASGDAETNSYVVEWPTKGDMSEKEKAEAAHEWAQAYSKMGGGSPIEVASAGERRMKLGMDPEYGSDAPDVASAQQIAANATWVPDEFDVPRGEK